MFFLSSSNINIFFPVDFSYTIDTEMLVVHLDIKSSYLD